MAFCLLQSEKDKLIAAIRSGDLNMERLYHMPEGEARAVFEKVVGSDSAKLVNAEFEKAKITATKKAAADYVSVKDKPGFTKVATQGEFAKNLLNDSQKRDRALAALDARIQKAKDLQTKNAESIRLATDAEQKANLQFKDQKYQDTIDRLSVRREDTANPVNDRLVNKINSLQTMLSDSDYNDLASAKLGRELTPAQGDYIAKQATILRELAQDESNPENKDFGMSAEYYNRKANLQSFIDNLDPHAPLNVLGQLIDTARLSLITGFSTPIKVTANYLNHPAGIILRRISSLSLRGDNADVAKELNTKDAAFTKKTGTSLSQLRDKNDIGSILGSHKGAGLTKSESFDKPQAAGGTGVAGAVSKVLTPIEQAFYKVAITWEHQYSFNYVWRNTFYDVLNIRASSFARAEGLNGAEVKPRAEEIMRDAARLDPQTEAGKALREGAQAVAARMTNTNDTLVSRAATGMKNAINQITPNVRLGDLIEPMAKIPANVIANGIATTPAVGVPAGLWDVVRGKANMMGDKPLETRYEGMLQYKKGIESLIGVVGSLTAAGIITSNLTSKDFRYDKYGNSFMKVGDLWINTEYMARIAPNIAGMMSIKMDPKQNPVKEFITGNAVGEGSFGSLIKTPGLEVLSQTTQAALGPKPITTATKALESRAPSILLNMFKPGDLERKTFRVFFGASGVETTDEYKADTKAAAQKSADTKKTNARNKARGIQTF